MVTDLGQVTALVRERVRDVHALVLEANHDPDLLEGAPYPWALKQRIQGRKGHLSNQAAASLLRDELLRRREETLKIAVAAHISENSNTEKHAVASFREACVEVGWMPQIAAASVRSPTELFEL